MPAFATLLLHLDCSARTGLRTRLARELAESFGARVRGQYGVTPSLLRYPLALEGAGAAADAMARYDDECRERARLAFEEARAGAAAMAWSEVRTQGVADLAREALYADLLVLGQHNAAAPEAAETPADLVPQLLLESGRPALVIPWAGPVDSVGRRVLAKTGSSTSGRTASLLAVVVLVTLFVAALLQYVALASPIIGEVTRFDGGFDTMFGH